MHDLDSWRYRCPRGHSSFDVEGDAIYCAECRKRGWPSWHREVKDKRTGEIVAL